MGKIKIDFESLERLAKTPEEENKPEIKTEDVKLSYKVYGHDFTLSDADYIDYYRTRMKMMVMRFMLVGRISDKGVYKIKDEIKYDLISMLKEISDEGEDYIRGEAYFMKKYFYFHINVSRDGGNAKASLYLSEFVDDFLEEDYIVSHIADYEDVDDQHFMNKVKEIFNLTDVAIKNDELKIPNLAVLMQDEYDIDKYIGGLYDIASQIYVMRMLKLLEESGNPVCIDIIRRFRELSVDIESEENVEEGKRAVNKNTRLKALLDRAIDEKGGIEKLSVDKEKLKNIVHEINKSVKAIDGLQRRPAAIEVLRTDTPKAEGGSAKPKKVAGKPQSKAAGNKGKPAGKDSKKPSSKSSGKGDTKKETKKPEEKDKKILYTGNPYEAIEKRLKKEAELKKRAAEKVDNENENNEIENEELNNENKIEDKKIPDKNIIKNNKLKPSRPLIKISSVNMSVDKTNEEDKIMLKLTSQKEENNDENTHKTKEGMLFVNVYKRRTIKLSKSYRKFPAQKVKINLEDIPSIEKTQYEPEMGE